MVRLDAQVTAGCAGATDAPGEPIAADQEMTSSVRDYTTFPLRHA